MLSYTTYQIPETNPDQTGHLGKWLWMAIPDKISEDHRELLQKISTALKADFDKDVYLLHCAQNESVSLFDISESHPKMVISFGLPPEQIGLWVDIKKPGMIILESLTFILTLGPDALTNSAMAKKELWGDMQSFLKSQPG